MVKHFKPGQLPIGWARRVTLLTSDFNFEVRQELARQMKSIFKHLTSQQIYQSKMVERYVEILTDSEQEVKRAGWGSLPWVLEKIDADATSQHILPLLSSYLNNPNLSKVNATLLYNIGKICQALSSQGLFNQMMPSIINLIKSSFIDIGKTLEDSFAKSNFKGLRIVDPEADSEGEDKPHNSEWITNQLSLCFNLPALATFLPDEVFFKVLYSHLQSLSGNQFINIKLSIVLPQTCLCLKQDDSRVKIMELLVQISNLAIND